MVKERHLPLFSLPVVMCFFSEELDNRAVVFEETTRDLHVPYRKQKKNSTQMGTVLFGADEGT